ncbi:cytochrome P450 [Roridomyces roridus]|uniref:Cytochrome P450 n=1 Tax=Roridomyces roridus TaxID=1738132 RepID=A0AAD7CKH8_9AGAR|nr:cytochrome P450 [Roridomyces roridus]
MWALFHVHPARGDYAACFYAVSGFVLYYITKSAGIPDASQFTISLLAIHVLSALISTVIYRLSPWHPLANFPGPFLWRTSSLRMVFVSFTGKRQLVIDLLHQRYGSFVRIGPNHLSVNFNSANNIIYGPRNNMEKADSYITPGHLDATTLFFKHKPQDHLKRKHIWSPAFSSTSLTHLTAPLERRTWELCHCIERRQKEDNGLFDFAAAFNHYAYDVMGEIVFGGCNGLELMKYGDAEGLLSGGRMATVIFECVGQAPWLMDLFWHLPAGNSMVRLRKDAAKMMRKRVQAEAETTVRDLSSHLIEGETLSGDRIPLKDLELDALVAIQAGSDTISSTMILAFFYLLSSPHRYYSKLQQELDKAFADRMGPLDWDVLAELPFLDAVINETLRLSTPWYLPRVVPSGGVVIEGKHIPEGTVVALAAHSQHVSPENFYPEPLSFRPDRWLPDGLGPTSRTEKSALTSFSTGPHVCVAKAFAYQEMRYAIARLVLTFDFDLAPNFDCGKFEAGVSIIRTALFKEPLLVSARRRSDTELPVY